MTQKDPIWPVRELMGYRPMLPATKRTAASDCQSAGAIEPLERRTMISGPMSIVLAAAMAPACEMHLGFDAKDDLESQANGTVAGESMENPGDAYDDAASKCCPESASMQLPTIANESEMPRTYTLATIHLPTRHDVRHPKGSSRRMAVENGRQAPNRDLALQIMASGVAIDFDQAAEVSAMLNHHTLLPGIVFNPVAGIAALVA